MIENQAEIPFKSDPKKEFRTLKKYRAKYLMAKSPLFFIFIIVGAATSCGFTYTSGEIQLFPVTTGFILIFAVGYYFSILAKKSFNEIVEIKKDQIIFFRNDKTIQKNYSDISFFISNNIVTLNSYIEPKINSDLLAMNKFQANRMAHYLEERGARYTSLGWWR